MESTDESRRPAPTTSSPGGLDPGRPGDAGPGDEEPSSTGLDANVAALLCYALGVVTGVLFLVLEGRSSFVRFHAWQSTVTFGALLLIQLFGGFIPFVGPAITALVAPVWLVLWILLMWKAYQGERFKLPFAGDVAEEHAALDA